jgi:type I restriction enzyme S subunit
MSALPRGWVTSVLETLCISVSDGDHQAPPRASTGIPFITISSIGNGRIDLENTTRFVPRAYKEALEPSRDPQRGDIVLSVTGSIGRAAIVDNPSFVFQRHIALIKTARQIEQKYLYYFFTSPSTGRQLEESATGTAQKTLPLSKLRKVNVPLPPLAEQKRIVAKLDALNEKSARARTELSRIETLVSRYKQAVLSTAFSGELIGLIPVATQKPHALCWDLPSGWGWVAFQDAVEIASNLVNPATIPDLPHIAPDNIEGGTTRLLPFNTIREDGVISAKHRFYAGQVLYSKIRPYLRKAVIVDFDGACSADMYPLSPRGFLSARYLLQWLVGEQFTHFAIEHQGRTVLPKINQNALNQIPLPLPPLAEQDEIVRRIESAFSKIDRLAIEARRALKLVSKLDEAILAKAFRGELVSQNEKDEPAEKLLERIRTEQDLSLVKPKRNKRVTSMSTAREFLDTKLENWPADGVNFQDLKREFGGSYDDLKEAVFASLSDEQSPLQQIFDDKTSTMAIRKRER